MVLVEPNLPQWRGAEIPQPSTPPRSRPSLRRHRRGDLMRAPRIQRGEPLATGAMIAPSAAGMLRVTKLPRWSAAQSEVQRVLAQDRDVAPEDNAPDPSRRLDAWTASAVKADAWIDALALQALSQKLATPTIVIKRDGERIKRYTLAPRFSGGYAMGSKNCQPLALLLEGGHYRHLCPPADVTTFPKDWLKATEMPGAGKSPKREGTPSLHGLSSPCRSPSLHTLVSRAGGRGVGRHRSTQVTYAPLSCEQG